MKYCLEVCVAHRDDPVAVTVYTSVHAALDAVRRLYTTAPPRTLTSEAAGDAYTYTLAAPRHYEITVTPYRPSRRP